MYKTSSYVLVEENRLDGFLTFVALADSAHFPVVVFVLVSGEVVLVLVAHRLVAVIVMVGKVIPVVVTLEATVVVVVVLILIC